MATGDYSPWQHWTSSTTATYTSTGTDEVWYSWVCDDSSSTDASTTCSSETVWQSWTREYTIAACPNYGSKKSHKEIQARLRYQNQAEINKIWQNLKSQEAELTAQTLLEDLLDDNQLKIYRETGRVLVKGRRHDYIVRKSRTTIKKLNKNKVIDMCCHLDYRHKRTMPETDNTIAKLLAIKYDEKRFNKLANFSNERELDELPAAAIAR